VWNSTQPANLFDDRYLAFVGEVMNSQSAKDSEFVMKLSQMDRPRILDAPCGYGRMTAALVEAGCSYVGIDREPAMIEAARRINAALTGVSFAVADLESLDFNEEFDVVLNWFTSFGYDDDEASLRCLASSQRALRPGGKLLMEHVHAPRFLRRVREEDDPQEIFDVTAGRMVDRYRLSADGRHHEMLRRYEGADGLVTEAFYRSRLLHPEELAGWLRSSGFADIEFFGGTGDPLAERHHKMIVRAVKA
jgi:SAM-dependent methyltransferase